MFKKITSTPLWVIVLINLVLKLGMFCYISPWYKTVESTKIVISDSRGYEDVAENLLHYHSYASPADTLKLSNFSDYKATGFLMWYPDGWMMPLYPTFLAAVYSVTGIKPYMAIFVQILLSLISVILVYRICTILFKNNQIATIAALLFALDIHSIYMANELLTDTLFVLLFLAGIYYFLKGMMSGKLIIFCLGAFFIGLACLTRLLALIYPLVLILILVAFSAQKMKWKLKAVLSYILIMSFMAGIWSFRNYNQYGRWQITIHGGWTLLFYYSSLTEERITHGNLDSIRVSFQEQADSLGYRKTKNIFDQSAIYEKVAFAYISKHKGMYLLTNLEGCINMFLSLGNMGMATTFGWNSTPPKGNFAEVTPQRILQNFTISPRETTLGIVIALFLALQYFGAVYGIIKLFFRKNFMVLSLVLLTIAYFAVVSGALGSYRFKLPVVPFICLAAGYGYAHQKVKKKPEEESKVLA